MTTLPRTGTPSSDAGRIAALLAELRSVSAAVVSREWVSGGLAGDPDAPIGAMTSTERPLSALDSAGVGFLTPLISFLEEPLDQLRGDPDSVSSRAGEFDSAGQDATSVAEEYRSSAAQETSEWTGQAGTDYLTAGTELADGILSIGETALTSGKALIEAGEVVAKVVAAVTRLITEAIAEITPIITQALAAAPATFGQSLAVAIPQCVQIAVEYGGRIAGKLAELLTSGENLIKLVEGALGVLKVVKEIVSSIGEQSQSGAPSGDKPSVSAKTAVSEEPALTTSATEELA
ncbi:WXG100 family type VII secretion target [Saccharothrix luteola]|uniref:WXG100 family type VII secretion target n=1 Tax=Saccharothrix luteola TaxID=2893018 RepID=UPI001E2C9AC1|nr:hypothetical protein [Saccharothrix luteola]MCC8246099.1 hypothetical protein [Saccharothrix luteola]